MFQRKVSWFWRFFKSQRKQAASYRRRKHQRSVELLEPRQMLSATSVEWSLNQTTLSVEGTSEADTIEVFSRNDLVEIDTQNGTIQTGVVASGLSDIVINGHEAHRRPRRRQGRHRQPHH